MIKSKLSIVSVFNRFINRFNSFIKHFKNLSVVNTLSHDVIKAILQTHCNRVHFLLIALGKLGKVARLGLAELRHDGRETLALVLAFSVRFFSSSSYYF